MSKLFVGKMNVSKIDKKKLFKGSKGVYLDLVIWLNDEPDKYGNTLSFQQATKKDEPKIFLGEAKPYVPKEPEINVNDDFGVPF